MPTVRQSADLFALGLAAARAGEGAIEVLAPDLFVGLIGTGRVSTAPGATLPWRMKGGRDLALGLATLAAAATGRRGVVGMLTGTGLVIDTVDGLAVLADDGASLRAPVHPLGGWGGIVIGVASAVAAVVVARPPKV